MKVPDEMTMKVKIEWSGACEKCGQDRWIKDDSKTDYDLLTFPPLHVSHYKCLNCGQERVKKWMDDLHPHDHRGQPWDEIQSGD